MKRWLSLCFCYLLAACLLCSCQPRLSSYEDMLNYPGLTWGMSPDQVKSALSLPDETTLQQTSDGFSYFEYTPDEEVFGQVPGQIGILFGTEKEELTMVRVLYQGRTEEQIQTIKSALMENYGPLEDEVVISVREGSPELTIETFHNKGSKDKFYWMGKETLKDILTPEQAERDQQNTVKNLPYWNNDEYWDQMLSHTSTSSIIFDATEKNTFDLAYLEGACYITFDGSRCLLPQLLQEQIDNSTSSSD